MTAVLEIRLFGGLQIEQNSTPIAGFISNKVAALLVYLVSTGRVHQRDALAALLWGEMPEADAKNNLRQALANLRKLTQPHLIITRNTVAFETAVPYTLDTQTFEQQLHASRHQTGRNRFLQLHEATALYQGDFLAGFFVRDAPDFEEWMLAQRLRFRELALHALHSLTEHHLSRGEYGRAIDFATRLLALDAWREEAHRQLMLALARSGQRSAALAQYETCRQMLVQELGVAPTSETLALYDRIRAAGELSPHNFPPQPTPFVGRVAALAEIHQLLLNPACRLLTLVGIGGMGKTRLGLQAAERAHRQGLFLHGVFFVSLLGIDSMSLLATAVANAIGFALTGSREPAAQLQAYLRDKEMLLLLDNFEHLWEEAVELVQFLRQAPNLKLLLTSREPLNVQWEWPVWVEGLAVPANAPLETIQQHEALQLFYGRFRAMQPDFALTPEMVPHAVAICQLVGGMPLAIELAAAAGRQYSCAEIAAAIQQNLDFLTSRYRDTPPRQRSLRAVFDYSWQQLTAVEQQIFARLGLFQGGFTIEAAAKIAGAPAALLERLIEKSLLQRQPNGRYQLHETVRQYARSRLEEADTPGAYQRFADYFLGLAQQAEASFHGEQQADWLSLLDAEQYNFRAVLDWSNATGQPTLFATLCGALWQYWYLRSRYQEGLNWLTAVSSHLETLPPQSQSKILRASGVFATQLGNYDTAVDLLSRSLAIQRKQGAPKEIGLAINSVAVVLQAQGKLAEAIVLYQEGLALQRMAGDPIGVAQTLQNLGAAAIDQGNYAEAQAASLESLSLFRQLGLKWGIAYASINLALALLRLEQLQPARRHIMEGITLCQEIESLDSVAECLEVLAGIEQAEGQAGLAVELLAVATRLRVEVRSPRQAGSAADYEQLTAVLQQQLTPNEYAYHWASGQSRTVAEQLAIVGI